MGGPRVTPEQLERAAEVYGRTSNLHEAARAVGLSFETIRDAFKRTRIARNRLLHAQAAERGLRTATKHLQRAGDLVDRMLSAEGTDGPGLEPKDIAALINARARAAETQVTIIERDDRRRQSRLTRDKTRLECEYLRARIAGTLPAEKIDLTDDRLDARIDELLGRARPVAPVADGAGGTDPPPGSAGGTGRSTG